MRKIARFFVLLCILAPAVWAQVYVFPEEGRVPYLNMIQGAKKSLDVMIYVIDDPSLAQALIDAHDRGVKVRILIEKEKYSHEQSESSSEKTIKRLEQAGIPLKKTPDHVAQTHTKLIIQDSTKALVSTGNMDAESFDGLPGIARPARDFAVDVTNPEILLELQTLFTQDWLGQVTEGIKHVTVAPGPYRDWVLNEINQAEKSLEIYQQDFTDPVLQKAVLAALARGVQVSLIMTPYPFSKKWDKNIPFQETLGKKGACVCLRDDLYIHAKLVLIDRGTPKARALFGTSNFYAPSLDKNREIALLITDKEDLQTFGGVFDQDIKASPTEASENSL